MTCALLAAACDGSGKAPGGEDAASPAKPAAGDAKAARPQLGADDSLAKLKCPAKTTKGLAGPDIIGVKLGMNRDEALNVVRCHAKNAHIAFEDRWFDSRTFRTYETKLEKQAFIAQTGETADCDYRSYQGMQRCGMGGRQWDHVAERIKVAAPGVPGKETVVGVWRTQSFKEGETPAVESVIAALVEKYGPFQRMSARPIKNNLWSRRIELAWISGLDGAPLGEAHPLFSQCAVNVRGRMEEGQSWQDGCGMSIAATLLTPRANPDVIGEFSVGMMHQSELFAYQEALQLELDEIERKRRAEELEAAKSSDVKL
ncbi:MAG: hypothetical protein Kow00133_12510 [Amphiplicatus sp.]